MCATICIDASLRNCILGNFESTGNNGDNQSQQMISHHFIPTQELQEYPIVGYEASLELSEGHEVAEEYLLCKWLLTSTARQLHPSISESEYEYHRVTILHHFYPYTCTYSSYNLRPSGSVSGLLLLVPSVRKLFNPLGL